MLKQTKLADNYQQTTTLTLTVMEDALKCCTVRFSLNTADRTSQERISESVTV